jgi:hypothetical protein
MIKEKLFEDKRLLEKQLFWIKISYEECKKIGRRSFWSIQIL